MLITYYTTMGGKMPLLSVIITTKNEEANIGRLLDSIKKQRVDNFEVVVVDNSSTDNTKKIAKKYGAKVFSKGPERSAQRNFGVKKASGKYVMILDADMWLSKGLIKDAVEIMESGKYGALIIPEQTGGTSFMAKVRRFERDMYQGDPTIEVARIFPRKVFLEFKGYDEGLTGAEDYDLPRRISKKYKIGWVNKQLVHHEQDLSLATLLRKKYYYAKQSVSYAEKHPDLVATQGTILFRKAYLRNWREFIKQPVLGISFIVIRVLTTIAAVAGYISEAGVKKFIQTLVGMFKR